MSKTVKDTDGSIYSSTLPHRIYYEDLHDVTKGEKLELKSGNEELGDLYSYLLYNVYDAELKIIKYV